MPCTATVGDLFSGYLSYLKGRKASSYDHARRVLTIVEAKIGAQTPIQAVTARSVLPVLAEGYSKGSKAQTAWTRALLRTVWNWAIRSPLDYRNTNAVDFGIQTNPLEAIPADSATLTKSRSRYFTQAELPGYIAFLHSHSNNPASAILELLLYTGARVEELADLEVRDYNRNEQTLLLRQTKAGNDHILGLGDDAVKLINKWTEGKNSGDPVFPSTRKPLTSVTHNSVYVFFQKSGLTDACPRDTRRTFKTLAQVAGIDRETLDIIQNHRDGSIASKHYDKYFSTSNAIQRMRQSLTVWEQWLWSDCAVRIAA
jgi:integrase